LYSKSFLTIPVSRAKAHITHLISPGGKTPYLSLISQVVPPESVIVTIAERFLCSSEKTFFNQYKTLNVPDHPQIVVIFIFVIISLFINYFSKTAFILLTPLELASSFRILNFHITQVFST